MSQTTGYNYESVVGQAGQIFDLSTKTIDSFSAEGTIGFGLGLTRGTDPAGQCSVIDDAGDAFLGVSVFEHTHENPLGDGDAGYADTQTVSTMTTGRVWVEVSAAVAVGDEAHVVVVDGRFTNSAGGNVAVPNGTFLTAAEADGLAVLQF